MVFYIIACHKEGLSEVDTDQLLNKTVLKENNRSLGEVFPLTNSVSSIDFLIIYVDKT